MSITISRPPEAQTQRQDSGGPYLVAGVIAGVVAGLVSWQSGLPLYVTAPLAAGAAGWIAGTMSGKPGQPLSPG